MSKLNAFLFKVPISSPFCPNPAHLVSALSFKCQVLPFHVRSLLFVSTLSPSFQRSPFVSTPSFRFNPVFSPVSSSQPVLLVSSSFLSVSMLSLVCMNAFLSDSVFLPSIVSRLSFAFQHCPFRPNSSPILSLFASALSFWYSTGSL